jgi:nitrogen fixation NifU-like protein
MPSDELEKAFDSLKTYWLGASSGPFSEKVLELAYEPPHVGAMDDCSTSASVTDVCGDQFEVFLKIEKGRVSKASFLSEGCGAVMACGGAMCELVTGLSIEETAELSCGDIVRFLGGLPDSHLHCAEQAVRALKKAMERKQDAFHPLP